MAVDLSRVDAIVDRQGAQPNALIAVLLDIQAAFSYLPAEALERVAERFAIPAIRVYQVAHFYKAFTFQPHGRHTVSVCAGTACHVNGGASLLEQIGAQYHLAPGETTEDGELTLETTNCPGNCPAGPVLTIDGTPLGRAAADRAIALLAALAKPDGGRRDA